MLSFFPRGVLDEIFNLIESVSEGFPSYSSLFCQFICPNTYIFTVYNSLNIMHNIPRKKYFDMVSEG